MNGPSAAWAALHPAAAFEAIDEAYGAGVGEVQRAPQFVDAHVRVCRDRDERRRCSPAMPATATVDRWIASATARLQAPMTLRACS